MEKDIDTVDVVIKIRRLDDYRTRPKTVVHTDKVKNPVNSSSPSYKQTFAPGSFESKVLLLIEKHTEGIKAREIAEKLRVDKTKVNSLLYSLKYKKICTVDELYRWTLPVKKSSSLTPSAMPFNATASETVQNVVTDVAIEPYIEYFEHLSVGIRGDLRAPHKYVLLIAILCLILRGVITSNRFKPSKIIDAEFNKVWSSIVTGETPFKPHPTYPYWHMMSEPFWSLLHADDGSNISTQWEKPILSAAKQREELVIELDWGLFNLAKDRQNCEQLIQSLVRCYNSPVRSFEEHHKI